MTWFDYVLTAWLALGALLTTATVGKPRDPITPATAVVGVIIATLLVFGLVFVG